MNSYEKLLEIMRKQGSKDNPTSLQLGRCENNKVKVGNQILDPEDYLIADGLKVNEGDLLLVYQISDAQFIIICKVVST